jgi:hypothetical protein
VTYSGQAQPIFAMYCAPCHTIYGADGVNFASNYADTQVPSNLCPGLDVGACTLVLIQEGFMPDGAGCTGDPAQDAANTACLTAAAQATIQAWLDDGQLP